MLLRVEQRGRLDAIDVPPVASSTSATASPTIAPTSSGVSGGGATDFCGAFKELESVRGATTPAAAGAGHRATAAHMRTYAPAAIKDAAGTYADLMDNIGKAAQSGTMDQQSMQKAIAAGMAGKSEDIAKVAIWVSKELSAVVAPAIRRRPAVEAPGRVRETSSAGRLSLQLGVGRFGQFSI